MNLINLAQWAKDDLKTIGDTWDEFVTDIKTPWTFVPGLITAIIVALMMALPWLTNDERVTGWMR